jgi:hypothetical protein
MFARLAAASAFLSTTYACVSPDAASQVVAISGGRVALPITTMVAVVRIAVSA